MRRLVGANFRRWRIAKNLKQEEVQARSGFSQQYISKLETGERNPTIVTLFELAQAIGVSHVDLVTPLAADEIERILLERPRRVGRTKSKKAS